MPSFHRNYIGKLIVYACVWVFHGMVGISTQTHTNKKLFREKTRVQCNFSWARLVQRQCKINSSVNAWDFSVYYVASYSVLRSSCSLKHEQHEDVICKSIFFIYIKCMHVSSGSHLIWMHFWCINAWVSCALVSLFLLFSIFFSSPNT